MGRDESGKTGPGSIAETVALLAIWARRAPRGFAHVEYSSEYTRAEADRRLADALSREGVPYQRVELPVWATPSEAARSLIVQLEWIETGAVSITGFATAVAVEDRRDFLAILSLRREDLAGLGLCQIWWLTPDFLDALMNLALDLDSWFMVRLKLDEVFSPMEKGSDDIGTMLPIDDAMQLAADLVERFRRAKEGAGLSEELQELASAAAEAIVGVNAPGLAKGLADRLLEDLIARCPHGLADCLTTLRSLNAVALLLRSQDRTTAAMPLIDRAWTLANQAEATANPELARDLHNLALFLRVAERPDLAEVITRRSLAIAERVYGPRHPSVAHCLKNLAAIVGDTGRMREAETFLRQALAIDEVVYGPDHLDVGIDLNELAVLLRSAGRLTEAESLFRRALAIMERWLGLDNLLLARTLNNLGVLLRSTGRLDEAEALHRRALAIDEKALGPDHPGVATDLVNLASVLRAAGRAAEAEPLLVRALAIDENSFPADHPAVARDREQLASLRTGADAPPH